MSKIPQYDLSFMQHTQNNKGALLTFGEAMEKLGMVARENTEHEYFKNYRAERRKFEKEILAYKEEARR
ncbi:hypothetical protein CCZ01_07825 [Helicobacter monodelphidis]|uniref:hypothetical protein n=1 Tax=Helicobacter sp. 15-1451 TaxID=2004995 RepID=UPI000DCC2883|nr:hypothetical protein [Helicobacter sp. 15-1451]RAX56952.1 hypothetical protein CCZ01_07825 [Helicobacter sp. 15-1451]